MRPQLILWFIGVMGAQVKNDSEWCGTPSPLASAQCVTGRSADCLLLIANC